MKPIRYYRKKPVVITATEIEEDMLIETREGTMKGSKGDMLITGVKGEQYACKPDIFEETYDEVVWNTRTEEWERLDNNAVAIELGKMRAAGEIN